MGWIVWDKGQHGLTMSDGELAWSSFDKALNAHAEGKWIGICGELAADLSLTERFLQMNIDELSVAPGMILPLRKKIREL